MLPAAIAGPLLIFVAYSVSFRYKLPEKARPEYWLQAVLDFLNSEPTLEAENGRNSNAACNPLEYDSLGQKMQRNKEDLCLITEFQTAIKEVMKPISDRRTQLNDSRKKLNMGCRDTNRTAKKYSPHEIRELMAAFQKLDENDDLLIDKHEFLEALVHFNPRTKHFADAAVFEIADVKTYGLQGCPVLYPCPFVLVLSFCPLKITPGTTWGQNVMKFSELPVFCRSVFLSDKF